MKVKEFTSTNPVFEQAMTILKRDIESFLLTQNVSKVHTLSHSSFYNRYSAHNPGYYVSAILTYE